MNRREFLIGGAALGATALGAAALASTSDGWAECVPPPGFEGVLSGKVFRRGRKIRHGINIGNAFRTEFGHRLRRQYEANPNTLAETIRDSGDGVISLAPGVYSHPQNWELGDRTLVLRATGAIFTAPDIHWIRGGNVLIEGARWDRSGSIWSDFDDEHRATLFLSNCEIEHSAPYHGVMAYGSKLITQRLLSRHSHAGDGINYNTHEASGQTSLGIEIDAICTDNGVPGTEAFANNAYSNKNGSSAHDGTTVIRIGGVYADNFGSSVIDSGAHRTWMIGCDCRSSREVEAAPYGSIHMEGTAYLDTVAAGGSGYSIVAAPGSKVFGTNLILSDPVAGTVAEYDSPA